MFLEMQKVLNVRVKNVEMRFGRLEAVIRSHDDLSRKLAKLDRRTDEQYYEHNRQIDSLGAYLKKM